ncbi:MULTISPECIES: FAD-binding oxidoreductase [unclassified Prochlorococcus]|nr:MULTISPECIES: FAD-binding oxidoreductase [unclassified Prochlorococcus]
MRKDSSFHSFLKDIKSLQSLEIFFKSSERKRYSRDFFDYSPVLKELLHECCADLVVKPLSANAIVSVAELCQRYKVPLTLRGSGTGNYGQCVPINGGVVMLMTSINKIRNFDSSTGDVTVEAGCLLGELNKYLLNKGRHLKLMPSTCRTASVAGFIAGGSGGIGSVRWGFLRDPGHLLALEIVTLEKCSRKIQLDASSAEAINHAYGTNGIITALKLSTCIAIDWHEIAIDCNSFSKAMEILLSSTQAAVDLFLCTLLDKKIIEHIPSWSGEPRGKHRLLLLVSPNGITTLERISQKAGADFYNLGPEKEKEGNGLRELSWNHTTMHMRSIDSNLTYLQMLLPQPEINAINAINAKWGDNILWHLEGVRQQGVQRIAALPLIQWQGQKKLESLMKDCKEAGAVLFNPHVITVEDGGLGVIDSDQVQAKKQYDPQGILNPGKLRGWQQFT